jgi:ATP-binding cassette subfamily B protein
MIFNKTIQLKKAVFYYESDKDKVKPVWVLNNINITIIKGQFVGFSGETGCGKSTLLDILMGLLEPVDGELLVDGKKVDRQNVKQWQLNISHVPQDIHLSDATIEENIAFGIPKDMIDSQRVKKAAEQAQIAEVIQNMPNSYDSLVGERGIRLSGGQRQRIGIARALYGQANVLILDEATSALDVDTERKVIESIRELGSSITTLMISHRITTLRSCDQLIKM